MTQTTTPREPEEFLSLSTLARWAHLPTEKVRREIKKGTITPDARSAKEVLFRKSRAAEVIKALHGI